MTDKPAQIAKALLDHVATLVIGDPPLPIAMPEHADGFKPPADGKYLEVRYFPNATAWEGLAAGALDQGLLQITVVWPKNEGVITPNQIAGQVMAHMPKNRVLFEGPTKVKINREPRAAAPISDDTEVRIPVIFSWVA